MRSFDGENSNELRYPKNFPNWWCQERMGSNLQISGLCNHRQPSHKRSNACMKNALVLKYGMHNGLFASSDGYGYSHLEDLEGNTFLDRWTCRRLYSELREQLDQKLKSAEKLYWFCQKRARFSAWIKNTLQMEQVQKQKCVPRTRAAVGFHLLQLQRRIFQAWQWYAQHQRDHFYKLRCCAIIRMVTSMRKNWLQLAFTHWRKEVHRRHVWLQRCFDHLSLYTLQEQYNRFLRESNIGDSHYKMVLKKRVLLSWSTIAKRLKYGCLFLWKLRHGLIGIAWKCWLQVITWEKTCEQRLARKVLRCIHNFVQRRKTITSDLYVWILQKQMFRSWKTLALNYSLLRKTIQAWREETVAGICHAVLTCFRETHCSHWARVLRQAFDTIKNIPTKPAVPVPSDSPSEVDEAEEEAHVETDPEPYSELEPESERSEPVSEQSSAFCQPQAAVPMRLPLEIDYNDAPAPCPSPKLQPLRVCRCVRCLRKYGKVGAQPFRPNKNTRCSMVCSQSSCEIEEHLLLRIQFARNLINRKQRGPSSRRARTNLLYRKGRELPETKLQWQRKASIQESLHLKVYTNTAKE